MQHLLVILQTGYRMTGVKGGAGALKRPQGRKAAKTEASKQEKVEEDKVMKKLKLQKLQLRQHLEFQIPSTRVLPIPSSLVARNLTGSRRPSNS
jgi:hypothetical protein